MSSKVVSEVTGIKVDNYLAMDFTGFTKIIDQLGGIDIKVTVPFTDRYYPLNIGATDNCGKSPEEITALEATLSGEKLAHTFTCRYETLVFNVGTTHLDGTTALKYVRSRNSDSGGGDFNRSLRQKQVMLAVRDKVLSLSFFTKILPIYRTLTAHIRTDLTPSDFEKFIARGLEFSDYKVESISLNDKNVLTIGKSAQGQSILIPVSGIGNYESVQHFISTGSLPTPTSAPTVTLP